MSGAVASKLTASPTGSCCKLACCSTIPKLVPNKVASSTRGQRAVAGRGCCLEGKRTQGSITAKAASKRTAAAVSGCQLLPAKAQRDSNAPAKPQSSPKAIHSNPSPCSRAGAPPGGACRATIKTARLISAIASHC